LTSQVPLDTVTVPVPDDPRPSVPFPDFIAPPVIVNVPLPVPPTTKLFVLAEPLAMVSVPVPVEAAPSVKCAA